MKSKYLMLGILILIVFISGCAPEIVEKEAIEEKEEAFASFKFVEGDSESWQVQSSEMGKYVLSPSWFRFEYASREGKEPALICKQFKSLEDARNNINQLSEVKKEPIEKAPRSYSLILSEKGMKETLVNINIAVSNFPPKDYVIYKYEAGEGLSAEKSKGTIEEKSKEKGEEGSKQPSSIGLKFLRKIELEDGTAYPGIIFANNQFYVTKELNQRVSVKEYDKDFVFTGKEYQLTDITSCDHKILFVDNYFYLVYGAKGSEIIQGSGFKKFDSDWNEIKEVGTNEYAPQVENEFGADPLFYYAEGSFYVGNVIDNPPKEGGIPGSDMSLHIRRFNTNLEFQDEFYLNEVGGYGLSMILQDDIFLVTTSVKIIRYDKNWKFIDKKRIAFPKEGTFSFEHYPRGFLFEDGYYFISCVDPIKKSPEGDIALKIFDSKWNLLDKVKVTDDIPSAQGNVAHIALVENKIYVAYDFTDKSGPHIAVKEYEIIEQEKEAGEKLPTGESKGIKEKIKEFLEEETLTQEQKEIVEFLEAEDEQFDEPAVNKILADFRNNYFHYIPAKMTSFTNKEVSGMLHFDMDLRNLEDDSGEPVVGLGATFTTDLVANNWKKEDAIKIGPPNYVFSYDDVPQEEVYIGGGFRPSPHVEFNKQITFTPGFDAFRFADKTVFSGPGTQTLTITVIPREKDIWEKGDGFGMCIYTIEPGADNLVDVIITSPTTDGEHFVTSEDGHSLRIYDIDVKTDTPWSVNLTLEVTPKQGVSKVKFMPFVSFLWNPASFRDDPTAVSCVMESGNSGSKGTTEGSSISCVTDTGVAKWKAKGNYIWDWRAGLCAYAVMFEHLQERVEDE
ncbi:MAG: hypothetical protein U9R08_02140 [Nanoarchaeota archaeon]|nr:hypothetical protein [Nanoarchaeota archaeon]